MPSFIGGGHPYKKGPPIKRTLRVYPTPAADALDLSVAAVHMLRVFSNHGRHESFHVGIREMPRMESRGVTKKIQCCREEFDANGQQPTQTPPLNRTAARGAWRPGE
jgi:hypothetical protein